LKTISNNSKSNKNEFCCLNQDFRIFRIKNHLNQDLQDERIFRIEKLSNVLARVIVQLETDQYEQAKQRAFAKMDTGYHLGENPHHGGDARKVVILESKL
jgi:hypothetical protein